MMFKSHVYHTLPAVFDITVRMLQREKELSVEEMINALKRDETFRMLKSPLDAATDAFYTSGLSRSLRNQPNNTGSKWCTFCKRSTHNTDDCFTKPGGNKNRKHRHDNGEGNPQIKNDPDNRTPNQCWYCMEIGHHARNCPIKEAAKSAKERFYKKVHPNEPPSC
jgi:hypothetical protein